MDLQTSFHQFESRSLYIDKVAVGYHTEMDSAYGRSKIFWGWE